MSFISSITALNLHDYTLSTENTASSGKTQDASSIFTQNKTSKTNEDKKNLPAEQIAQKVADYSNNFIQKYDCSKQKAKVENIEKSMRFSKNPQLCSVPANLKNSIKMIGDEIVSEINNFSSSASSCKTEDEVKTLAKELESKLQQKKHQANVYTQRALKAQQLDNKLMSIASDPKKAKILDTIDMDKIVQKLTEPVENVKISEETNSTEEKDDKNDKGKKEVFENALKNDEISNVITSLIKYADGQEKDKILDDYLKKEDSNNNTPKEPTENLFALNTNFSTKKKNPFSSDV